ncbi:hypothetical protein AF335_14345 [Streptomyces eurocidicus]|uniref:Fe2OG dioxygenase domain-containing protein n=1 Tax=Streptomyces eurocidicus TaxID=66423 RepID=A0A2N8NWH2_STREU|nr:hypothetical protein [Streptomyces eurocidicus]MBB5122968.1 hypothetical protein [Streptomyces eurocidicus]MBF6056539.1 hypothetical protein [Streptomyces eurocidicus]PNE33117.1 hypothetical protein AF335_14345 [Streptomyces eurocidicus]
MIHLSETLALQSVEGFLSPDELAQLGKIMDDELAASGWTPGTQAEVVRAPGDAQAILREATARALPVLRHVLPSVAADAPWGYTELTAGREVPAHIDGIPEPAVAPRRIGRIGVTLEQADAGGEFYVETTASATVWSGQVVGEREGYAAGTGLTRRLPHPNRHETEPVWLRDAVRTRWVTGAPAGVALAYGAQLVHGVLPVRSGRLRKFVTDLLDTRLP